MIPKLDITQDILPLTTFRNNSVKSLKQLKKTGRPIILTVNGKPEAALLSAAALQNLLDIAAAADEREGVRQGDADISAGRVRPASEVFHDIRKDYDLSR